VACVSEIRRQGEMMDGASCVARRRASLTIAQGLSGIWVIFIWTKLGLIDG
jgi:hypothetical protein